MAPSSLDDLLSKIYTSILNPIIALLFAAALVMFLWGVADMIRNVEDQKNRKEGQRHMFWGIVGMFIMVAVWGIIAVIKNTIGAQ
jgi:hypothetical protein